MTDLDDALDDELRAIAHALVDGAPDVPALRDAGGSARGGRPRWIVMAAAATVAVLGAVALRYAAVPREETRAVQSVVPETTPAAAEGVGPASFPVLDPLPDGLEVTALVETGPSGEAPLTQVLVARIVNDTITDPVLISVRARPFELTPLHDTPVERVTVFGMDAETIDYGSSYGMGPDVSVSWGDGPYFLANGADPIAFLDRADPSVLEATAGTDDTAPELTIGELPADFEVVVAPQAVGPRVFGATLSVGADNYDFSVSARNPLADMALAGAVRRVDIDGAVGWAFTSVSRTQDVTWQVDDTTYAYLKVNDGSDGDRALELARAVTFVDFGAWVERYHPLGDCDGCTAPPSSAPA